jgi:hypothetical protein
VGQERELRLIHKLTIRVWGHITIECVEDCELLVDSSVEALVEGSLSVLVGQVEQDPVQRDQILGINLVEIRLPSLDNARSISPGREEEGCKGTRDENCEDPRDDGTDEQGPVGPVAEALTHTHSNLSCKGQQNMIRDTRRKGSDVKKALCSPPKMQ